MSDEPAEIYVSYRPKDEAGEYQGSNGLVTDGNIFVRLCQLFGKAHVLDGFDQTKPRGQCFETLVGSANYIEGLAILSDAGLKPAFTHRLSPDHVTNRFRIIRGSAPSQERLDACEYVCLTWSDARVGYHSATEGEAIIAQVDRSEHRKAADIGALAPSHCLAVSANFIAAFRSAGLKGAMFHPIKWMARGGEPPSFAPAHPVRPCWLSAEKEMPRSLTPRVGLDGELTGVHFPDNEDLLNHNTHSCCWDDEGRRDYTLRFRRKEVAALGEFDIARTYEWLYVVGMSCGEPCWFPQLVVSQRFRQWAKKQKYKLHYGLCELVD